MKTQFDTRQRTVSLENLEAICARVSGVCHTYAVSRVSRSRVHVTYSNPSEYGTPNPITAVFPCYPTAGGSGFDGQPAVILGHMIRCINDRDGYGYQAFDVITGHLPLWRNGTGEWRTVLEIHGTDRYLCPDGKVRTVDASHPYTDDRFAAFEITAERPPETNKQTGQTIRHFVYFTWGDLQPVKPARMAKDPTCVLCDAGEVHEH